MDKFTLDGKKIKKGGTYLTTKGKIRKRFQKTLVRDSASPNKLYNAKDTYSFGFNGKGIPIDSLDFDDSKTLANSYLVETLAKSRNLKGSYRIIIKKDGEIVKELDYNMSDVAGGLNDLSEKLNDGESPYKVYNSNLGEDSRVVIIFAKNKKVPRSIYEQKYLDSATSHCFLSDIQRYYERRKEIQEDLGKSTKKSTACINKIVGKTLKSGKKTESLLEKYAEGIPESHINEVCSLLGVAVKIFLPFQKEPILEYKPPHNNFYGKTFYYLNTRLNHVENCKNFVHTDIYYKSFDATEVSHDELQQIVADKIANNEYCAYKKGYYGITSAKTVDAYYIVGDERSDVFREFSESTGIKWCQYDAVKNPLLDRFLNAGTHFNCTTDFRDTSELDSILANCFATQNIIKHIDQYKAYSQFFNCKWYEGFMGKITDFRQCEGKPTQVGFYLVKKLDFSKANPRFIQYNNQLSWFKEGNIYTYAELKALDEYKVKYTVSHGCWGVDMDFRFNDEMLEKKHKVMLGNKEHSVPYYSMYCGTLAMDKGTSSYYMNGDHRYFGKYAEDVFYNDASSETHITFENPSNPKYKHITGQITAYQRLILLEQLMKMNPEKIIRVCVDGIYYTNHFFKLHECFRHKEKLTFANSSSSCYLSHMLACPEDREALLFNLKRELAKYRPYHKSELWLGPGGTGKTYTNVETETGWINPVYVPHSWKLASKFTRDMKTLVHHSVNNDDKMNNWCKRYNVYLLDECSMLTEYQKDMLLKNIQGRIIFMGDLTGQLKPVVKTEEIEKWKASLEPSQCWRRINQMTGKFIDYITELTYVYRFICEKLRGVANLIREYQANNKVPANWLDSFQRIKRDTVADLYNHREDIILTPRHKGTAGSAQSYLNMFKELGKYKVKENKNGYYNGDIIYEDIKGIDTEQRHGYTVHSVQGETYSGKIFIDIGDMKLNKMKNPKDDLRIFYTAISRARQLNQIYLVE